MKFENMLGSFTVPLSMQLIQSLVKGVDVKCDPVMWQSLHNNIPVLFTLLEHSCGSSAPAELRPLLDDFLTRIVTLFFIHTIMPSWSTS
jgi:hypothetical protein